MTTVVIANGLAPPPDEGATAATFRYIEGLPGRVLLVNRSNACPPTRGVRTVRVHKGSSAAAKAISYVLFVAASIAAVALARGSRVRHFPLRPPHVASQLHGLL